MNIDSDSKISGISIKAKGVGIQSSSDRSTQTETVLKISRKLQTLPLSIPSSKPGEGEILGDSPVKRDVAGSHGKSRSASLTADSCDANKMADQGMGDRSYGDPEAEVQNGKDVTNVSTRYGNYPEEDRKEKKHKKAKKRKHHKTHGEKDKKDVEKGGEREVNRSEKTNYRDGGEVIEDGMEDQERGSYKRDNSVDNRKRSDVVESGQNVQIGETENRRDDKNKAEDRQGIDEQNSGVEDKKLEQRSEEKTSEGGSVAVKAQSPAVVGVKKYVMFRASPTENTSTVESRGDDEGPPAKKWKRNILERHKEETRKHEAPGDEVKDTREVSKEAKGEGNDAKDPNEVIKDAKELLKTFDVKTDEKAEDDKNTRNMEEDGEIVQRSREIGKGMRIKKKSQNFEMEAKSKTSREKEDLSESSLIPLESVDTGVTFPTSSVFSGREPSPFWSSPGDRGLPLKQKAPRSREIPPKQSPASATSSSTASRLERPVTPSPTHKKNISSLSSTYPSFSPLTPSGLTPVTPLSTGLTPLMSQATGLTPGSEQGLTPMSPPSVTPKVLALSGRNTSMKTAQDSMMSPFKSDPSSQPSKLPPLKVKQLYTPEKPNHPPVTVLVTPPKQVSGLRMLDAYGSGPQLISPKPVKTGSINLTRDSPLGACSTTPTSLERQPLPIPPADPPLELHFRSPQVTTTFQPIPSPQARSSKIKHSAIKALTFDTQVENTSRIGILCLLCSSFLLVLLFVWIFWGV